MKSPLTVLLVVWLSAAAALVPSSLTAEDAGARGRAAVLTLSGAIGPATAEYVQDAFAQARTAGTEAVVLRIDTPGGLSSSMREIIQTILASPIPVIANVAPAGARAASAGTYIVYASQIAAMAPSTHLGAATPVQLGGGLFGGGNTKKDDNSGATAPSSPEEAKVLNDAVAYIRSLAQLRGRNAEWAEKAIREAALPTRYEACRQPCTFCAMHVPCMRRNKGHFGHADFHRLSSMFVHFPSWFE